MPRHRRGWAMLALCGVGCAGAPQPPPIRTGVPTTFSIEAELARIPRLKRRAELDRQGRIELALHRSNLLILGLMADDATTLRGLGESYGDLVTDSCGRAIRGEAVLGPCLAMLFTATSNEVAWSGADPEVAALLAAMSRHYVDRRAPFFAAITRAWNQDGPVRAIAAALVWVNARPFMNSAVGDPNGALIGRAARAAAYDCPDVLLRFAAADASVEAMPHDSRACAAETETMAASNRDADLPPTPGVGRQADGDDDDGAGSFLDGGRGLGSRPLADSAAARANDLRDHDRNEGGGSAGPGAWVLMRALRWVTDARTRLGESTGMLAAGAEGLGLFDGFDRRMNRSHPAYALVASDDGLDAPRLAAY